MDSNIALFGQRGVVTQRLATPTTQALGMIINQLTGTAPLLSPEGSRAAIAMEGIVDTRYVTELSDAVGNLRALVNDCVKGVSNMAGLSVAQESAAVRAGVLAYSPQEALTRASPSASGLKAMFAGQDNVTVIGHAGLSDSIENRAVSLEAFDEKVNRNAVAYSVLYNMRAARQDAFGEAFFPTVSVSPDSVGFTVSIRLLYVYDEVRRELNGSLSKWGRKNAIQAIIDPTILRNDQTRLIPEFRRATPAAPATDTFAHFALDVGTTTLKQDGHDVVTGALAIGKRFDLLAVSQTAAVVAQSGQNDQTDAIDSSIRLGAIYVKLTGLVGGVATTNVLKFSTENILTSDFNVAPQGNDRMMQLNFTAQELMVNSGKMTVEGVAPSLLAGLGTSTVRLGTSLFGTVLQDKGETIVNASGIEVVRVVDDQNTELSTASGPGATLAALFATATVVGYDLIAYRTNSNRRLRGQLTDTQYHNYLFTVPLLPPITALRPVGETEVNDSALLENLIALTRIRTSNAAVTALLKYRDLLKEYDNGTVTDINESSPMLGIARFMLTPAYLEDNLNCLTALDSLSTTARTEDLQNLMINKIRDMAYRLYVKSGYQAALEALYAGDAPKTTVIIGTDPIMARYLNLTGDMRLMGDMFDFKLVHTLNKEMRGKIIFSFGQEASFNSGVPNALHFGNMAWKSELTLMMPTFRNNATQMELTVYPSFRHIANVPVLGVLNVTNIESVIATKLAVNNHPV